MGRILVLAAIAGISFIAVAHATSAGGNEAVRLEDVDADGDGVMSAAESEMYLDKIARGAYLEKMKPQVAPPSAPAPQQAAPVKPVAPPPQAAPKTVTAKDPYAAKDEAGKKVPAFVQKEEGMRVEDMKKLDINKDGVLSKDELNKSVAKKFGAADKDGDGVLSKAEIEANLNQIKAEKSEYGGNLADQYANRTKNRMKNADTDRDGKISQEEYKKYSDQYENNFDQDGDGKISKEEFRSEGEKLPRKDFEGKLAR